MKSTEERDATRERNRRRANCARCGGPTEFVAGEKLNPEVHFAGVVYKVCNSCGHEEPTKRSAP